ncbi:MAG TPA: hypothetical protein VG713_14165, partial [Pirellulales bacterium]|nr:hypothetical protein [Pirellulales bacterium]
IQPDDKPPVFDVEPGDIELERGSDLLVLARFAKDARLPQELTLHVDSANEPVAMQQSLSDPIFAARVPEVRNDLTYRVGIGQHRTQTYRVTVFEYPELMRADAELTYPEYTTLTARRIEDVRQLAAVEGSRLRWRCQLNKPVASARLVTAEGNELALEPTPEDPTMVAAELTLTTTQRWRLVLVDDRRRENRDQPEFVATVVPNRPPELKLTFPRRDLKVSPLQEVPLEATVSDDFGVERWGLAYDLVGKRAGSIVLGEKLPAHQAHPGRQTMALEDLQARPDELLAWHIWAEDLGADGKLRRTTSDIFFAEVSPFDEIFREASSDDGPPGGEQAQADEALKLQKEIISATWNLRRRERPEALSPGYPADVRTIADSQQKAIDSLAEVRDKLQAAEPRAILDEVEQQMRSSLQALGTGAEGPSLSLLDEALPAQQAAYQGLLRLRARENRISRSKGAQGGVGASANGQNLDQLELKEDDARYESRQRAGEANQTPAEREREEFLKRLRELARRQEDANEKIKELQAALDAARDEETRRELERQLKRLRDEQRDLLRDVDQLKNDFEQPEHNQPLAEASRQLDATREDVRQASNALEKGETSQALTAGKRAESELDQLREDFRKQTASQYADEVRNLVDRARELDERQQRIGEQLADGDKRNGKPQAKSKGSLRPSEAADEASGGENPQLPQELERQQKELGALVDDARQLTERAEGNEPLLTKQLYDALREAHHTQTQRAVEMMHKLAAAGLNREAGKIAPRAEQGVQQLRERIEKAAESVLGDDVESLRRAQRDVEQLAQALAGEMARENSQPQASSNSSPSDDHKARDGKSTEEGQPSAEAKPRDKAKGSDKGKAPAKAAKTGDGNSPGETGAANNADRNGSATQVATQDNGNTTNDAAGPGGALNGPDWRQWSDTLRNVEEFVPGTRLRSAAARVREQAQSIRAESKRHSKPPNWNLVRETVYEPLIELQRELNEELLRRTEPETVVPLDRDPVPDRFGEAVRKYYERLGSGQ